MLSWPVLLRPLEYKTLSILRLRNRNVLVSSRAFKRERENEGVSKARMRPWKSATVLPVFASCTRTITATQTF
jgi:hypothetical protein